MKQHSEVGKGYEDERIRDSGVVRFRSRYQAQAANPGSYIDVQLLCGAGYEKTVTYLEKLVGKRPNVRTVELSYTV
ncbi:hypothetical protein ACFVQB_27445 [Paenibacillus sp. NPDC057886]|uniref:hypothetical protein n=1 Tax=Paenibacillus sp. NPDC057886 TaxID=3346270 RepID=UPI00367C76B2